MFSEAIYAALGYIILRFRYPNKKERELVLKETYDDSYENAGAEWPLKIFGMLLGLLLLAMLIGVVYSIFKHGPTTP